MAEKEVVQIKLSDDECLYISKCLSMMMHVEDSERTSKESVNNEAIRRMHNIKFRTFTDIYYKVSNTNRYRKLYEFSLDELHTIERCLYYFWIVEGNEQRQHSNTLDRVVWNAYDDHKNMNQNLRKKMEDMFWE